MIHPPLAYQNPHLKGKCECHSFDYTAFSQDAQALAGSLIGCCVSGESVASANDCKKEIRAGSSSVLQHV